MTLDTRIWVSEREKLISCHEIDGAACFRFRFESDFASFVLGLLERSFRIM